MLTILNQPHQLMTKDAADKLAKELNADDEWNYIAIHDPKGTGLSFVEIRDEDGDLIGRI